MSKDLSFQLANLIANKKVCVLIDGANLYFGAQSKKMNLDFGVIQHWFASRSKSLICKYYTAFDPDDANQQKFLDYLKVSKVDVVSKPIKKIAALTKGNMDVELTVDAVDLQDEYEILVLLSGDGDFTYLVEYVEKLQKQVIIIGVGGFVSYELHQMADKYFFLDRLRSVWKRTSYNQTEQPTLTEDKPSVITTSFSQLGQRLQGFIKAVFLGENGQQENKNKQTSVRKNSQQPKNFQKPASKFPNSNFSGQEKTKNYHKIGSQTADESTSRRTATSSNFRTNANNSKPGFKNSSNLNSSGNPNNNKISRSNSPVRNAPNNSKIPAKPAETKNWEQTEAKPRRQFTANPKISTEVTTTKKVVLENGVEVYTGLKKRRQRNRPMSNENSNPPRTNAKKGQTAEGYNSENGPKIMV